MQQLLSTFHLLSGCAGLILTGNTVKHEQKKKDKSARLLKEMKSKAQDAVNLVHHQYIYPPLITRLQTQKKTLELQGLLDEVLLLFSTPTEPQNRSFYRDDIFQRLALDYAANEDKVRKRYEELERETQLLHVLTPIVPTSPTDPRSSLLARRHTWKKS